MQDTLEALWVVDGGVQAHEVHPVGSSGAVIPADNQQKFLTQA